MNRKTPAIDLAKFVEFEADHDPQQWRVAGVGRRGGETCTPVGVIRFKPPGRGHAVIVRFSDGKTEIIDPMDLLPSKQPAGNAAG